MIIVIKLKKDTTRDPTKSSNATSMSIHRVCIH
jgi:hypothetical protein